jgi:hypothetical protein
VKKAVIYLMAIRGLVDWIRACARACSDAEASLAMECQLPDTQGLDCPLGQYLLLIDQLPFFGVGID